jgi:hypothetical protein
MAKLKWDEERQAFKYQILSTRPVPGGNVVYISMEELPAGIKIESRNSQPVSVEVDDAYLKVKLPNLKRLKDLEDAEGATEFLTVEELNAKKEQALSGVADTTPFGEDASRVLNKSFIAQSPNFSRTAEGVGYIAPDALPGTEASMVYIRPGQDARGAMSLDAIDVISAHQTIILLQHS